MRKIVNKTNRLREGIIKALLLEEQMAGEIGRMTDGKKHTERYFVYVIGSRRAGDCRTYVGWTLDVERRVREHNGGRGAKSTRGRGWSLLHTEIFATKREAMRREWRLKRDRAFRRSLRDTWAQPPQTFVR